MSGNSSHGKPNVSFPVSNSTECPGYLSPLETKSKMGLVVIHEWWGLNVPITETVDSFARSGFRALVPDL